MRPSILRQGASVSIEEHREISKLLGEIKRLRRAIADKLGRRLRTPASDRLVYKDDLRHFRAEMDRALFIEHQERVKESLSHVYYGQPLLEEMNKCGQN